MRAALADVVSLSREEASAISDALGVSPYDALLDQYEPGGRLARIEPMFEVLAAELPPLLDAVLDRQGKEMPPEVPVGPFELDAQRALSRNVMSTLGFDFEHGRLDETLHPFCGGVPDDVRVTARYDAYGFLGIMGVIHETGHALYEMGLPSAHQGQPAGQARGMVLHESQSLLMEMRASRTSEFLGFFAPMAREAFGAKSWDATWSPDNCAASTGKARLHSGRVRRSYLSAARDPALPIEKHC